MAVSYRIKIGGLGREITSAGGKKFQPPVKYDFFRITENRRGADGNFIEAKEIMGKYPEKPREINIVFFSNELTDLYNDWRAAFKGRKCLCRTDDGVTAVWNTELEPLHKDLVELEKQPKGLRKSQVAIRCPEEDCPLTLGNRCKLNLILRAMILEAPSIGGVAEFRATSVNSALQIRASLDTIARITQGRFAGIPLVLKLEPRTTEKGVVHVVHIEYPQGLLDLKREASEISQKLLGYDKALATVLSVKYHFEDEDEIDGIVKEFYPEVAQEEAITVNGQEIPPDKVEETLDQAAAKVESDIDAIEAIWDGDKEPEEEEEPPATEPAAEEPTDQDKAEIGRQRNIF